MIKDNLETVRERINSACLRSGRRPNSVEIVAVSKTHTIEQIREVVNSGVNNIGENRVQEAVSKSNQLTSGNERLTSIKWHMVGHLQTNKAREAVRIFDLIQSVDSLKLANEINKYAGAINKVQDILIEVKTSPEATKFGFDSEEITEAFKDIIQLKNINIKGLMTIAPLVDDQEKTRPYFRQLRHLRDKIYELGDVRNESLILSMGMSDDFEVAVEEGASMIRLGRVIFN